MLTTTNKQTSQSGSFWLLGLLIVLVTVILIFLLGTLYRGEDGMPRGMPPIVAPNLDAVSRVCGYAIPTHELSPLAGTYKVEDSGDFTDYHYLANLQSVESETINGCEFVVLNFNYKSNPRSNVIFDPFKIHIPKNMPSPGTSSNILPGSMDQYKGELLDFVVRYSKENEEGVSYLDGILGWQFRAVFEL